MTLDITAGNEGAFGDFSEKEIRVLVLETAQALYRPAHDVLVSAHAEELRKWVERTPRVRADGGVSPPVFDDAVLIPVWAACLARARAHISDVLGLNLASDASALSSLQIEEGSDLPPDVIN